MCACACVFWEWVCVCGREGGSWVGYYQRRSIRTWKMLAQMLYPEGSLEALAVQAGKRNEIKGCRAWQQHEPVVFFKKNMIVYESLRYRPCWTDVHLVTMWPMYINYFKTWKLTYADHDSKRFNRRKQNTQAGRSPGGDVLVQSNWSSSEKRGCRLYVHNTTYSWLFF